MTPPVLRCRSDVVRARNSSVCAPRATRTRLCFALRDLTSLRRVT